MLELSSEAERLRAGGVLPMPWPARAAPVVAVAFCSAAVTTAEPAAWAR